ncbi:hypothetical protein FMN50_26750 [Rhodobacterales bacterium]|nr:hypothetical protein FMN50_26750 [Rhodobacterales bacterium]
MFHPKDAAEDTHAVNLAILFFAAFAIGLSIYFHHDSGLKYWLLKAFGESGPGRTLVIIDDTPDGDKAAAHYRSDPRNTLKNMAAWANERILVEFQPAEGPAEVVAFRMQPSELIRETDGALLVTYLPLNPRIAYPTHSLAKFRLDSQILLWSLVIGCIVLVLAWRSARKWRRFRTGMRQY